MEKGKILVVVSISAFVIAAVAVTGAYMNGIFESEKTDEQTLRIGLIDVAYFGPFSYVLATERANAEAIATGGTDTGDVATYHSCIITHKDSGLKKVRSEYRRDSCHRM